MRGSAYLLVITLLLLAATALLIGIVSLGMLASSREALKQALYEHQEEPEKVIFRAQREEWVSFQKKTVFILREKNGFVVMEREIYAKGEVPLSMFPDLRLRDFPTTEELLGFLGKFRVEERDGYFLLRGKKKALYFPFSVRIKTGRKLIINGRSYKRLPVIADGDCLVEGRGSLFLLCAGKVFVKARGGFKVIISGGGGFLKEGEHDSRITVEGDFFEGELLAESIIFRGKGTLKGTLQAMDARGNWLHIKKSLIIEELPRIFYFSYRFCSRERKKVEVEL